MDTPIRGLAVFLALRRNIRGQAQDEAKASGYAAEFIHTEVPQMTLCTWSPNRISLKCMIYWSVTVMLFKFDYLTEIEYSEVAEITLRTLA